MPKTREDTRSTTYGTLVAWQSGRSPSGCPVTLGAYDDAVTIEDDEDRYGKSYLVVNDSVVKGCVAQGVASGWRRIRIPACASRLAIPSPTYD